MLSAVDSKRKHRLWWDSANLSETIMEGWRTWSGPKDLPRRVIHGDLKISNLRFQGPQAMALIDLDTLQWGSLDTELGDAMRSWCNPAAEDSEQTSFDLPLFQAAMQGYAEGSAGSGPSEAEWAAIVPGLERICWELAARFTRDALEEAYFGWNPAFGGRGEHNLLRATGQTELAKSVRRQRAQAEAIVADARR
jgi:aminoglycoside phosphotransferase (APT) family kinase protein